jgi:chromosome segregation ATPase
MREEYEEKRFSPLKVGLAGAVIVAAVIAVLMQFRSYSNEASAGEKSQAIAANQLAQLRTENKELKEKVAELEDVSRVTADSLEKQLKQKESQLSVVKRQQISAERSSTSRISDLKKEKTQLESQFSQIKKDIDLKAQELKKAQDRLSQLETDVRNSRLELERQTRNSKILQDKLNGISEGDQSAADLMVQQLAETRQELKRERAVRQKLEEELNSLREQTGITPQ